MDGNRVNLSALTISEIVRILDRHNVMFVKTQQNRTEWNGTGGIFDN